MKHTSPWMLWTACALLLLLPIALSAQTIPSWATNTSYSIGALVMFNGVEYQCIQAHTSQVGWEPPNVPALWKPVSGVPAPTPTPTPRTTPTPVPTPTPVSGGGCFAAWNTAQIYTGGMQASLNGINYTAAFWNQNQSPATNNGPAGSGQPWVSNGSCVTPKPTPTPTPGPTPVPPPPGARLYAPYIDMSLTPDEQILTIQQQSGIRTFTLAFIVGNGGCTPTWGGIGPISNDALPNGTLISTLINGVRSAGGDVIISFGGASGSELALGCSDAGSLQAAYQAVINKYNVKMLDFDIEGGAVSDQASIDRRNQALKGLRAANANLVVSFTLPVLPTGLVTSGINILNSVNASGLKVDVINVMAMDYGSANDNGGQMGLSATQAASNTHSQIQAAGLSSTVGVTPMIGINDTNTEIFKVSDANMLLNFANSNSYITRIAVWSVARDNGGCPGQGFASPVCSGVTQNAYDFSHVFEAFR